MSAMDLDQDLSALSAARELDQQNAAAQALSAGGPSAGGAPSSGGGGGGDASRSAAPAETEGGLKRWMSRLPTNIGVSLIDAALETLDSVQAKNPEVADEGAEQGTFTAGMHTPAVTPSDRRNGLMMDDDHGQVVSALTDFRNEMAQGSRMSDTITQGIAQFFIPFIGWSKAFRGMQAAESAPKLAKLAVGAARVGTAESATMATAFDPHSGRMADLVALGKHTEGKIGEALNTIAPDGSAINAYIDYMTDRVNESDAEGRWKNVVDNLGVSLAAAALLKSGAKAIKAGHNFSMSPIKLPEIGSPEHLAAQGQKLADEALMQFPDSPHAAMVHLTEQADNALDDAEHATIKAARDKVAQGLPEQGYTVVPSPEGHTVVAGRQPVLTFEKEEDAVAAVADAQRLLGTNFNARAAAEHAKSSDANFATLHAFSRVLQTNKDRPVSTHSLLSALERNLKGDTEQGAFYKELLGRLVRKKIGGTTTVSSKGRKHFAGHYATAFNVIELYDGAFKNPKMLLHTFTHEAVHAATMSEMNASAGVMRKIERLRSIVEKDHKERVIEKGDKAREVLEDEGDTYGLRDAYEFVAEIESNPEFRKAMQTTTLPEGGTAWDKYLETIAGILGISALVATPAGQKEFSKLMMGPKQEEKPSA